MAFTRLLKLYQGLQEKYNSLQVKNPYAFYVTTDTKLLYKGEDLLSSVIWTDSIPAADVALEDIIYVVLNTQAGTAALYTLIGGEMVQISGADEKMDKVNPEGSGHFRFNGAADDYSYTLGDYSLAMGLNTKVSGKNSVAFGKDNSIEGDSTFVEGESNTILGDNIRDSHIEGASINAESSEITQSHIEGTSHTIGKAELYATHIEGAGHTINDSAHIQHSVIQGYENTVSGDMLCGSILKGDGNEVPSDLTLTASEISGQGNTTEKGFGGWNPYLYGTELYGMGNQFTLNAGKYGCKYGGSHNIIVSRDSIWGDVIAGYGSTIVTKVGRGNFISGDSNRFVANSTLDGSLITGDSQNIAIGGEDMGLLIYGASNKFQDLGTSETFGSGVYGSSLGGYNNTAGGIDRISGSSISGYLNIVTGFGSMTGCDVGGTSNEIHCGQNGDWSSTLVFGDNCKSQGLDHQGSQVMGYHNTVQGGVSGHIRGSEFNGSQNTITLAGADVDGHHIEGAQNVVTLTSNQSGVHIEGYSNTITAAGTGSHIQGRDHIVTLTSTKPVMVLGQGAVATGNKEYSVVIGNGNSQTKNNAVTIDYNGNIEIEGLLCQNLNNQDISVAAGASVAYTLDAIPEGRFFDFDIRESITNQGVTDYDVAYSGKLLKQKTNVKTVVTHYQAADITLSTTSNSVTITNNSASDRVFTVFTNII